MAKEQPTKLVQMRLRLPTLERLDNLVQMTGITNKAQAIAFSIEVTEDIVKCLNRGDKVFIESEDGKTRESLKLII